MKRRQPISDLRDHLKSYYRALPWITLKELLLIVISTVPYALTVNQLLVPHAIVGGGVTGLCEIIYFATNTYVPIWLSSALINILLLILAAITVGWRYALRTVWGVMWLTIWLKVIPIAPVPLLTDAFMAVIIGGLFTGCFLGICFLNNGSTGGTDIVAMIVNHYRDISLGNIMLVCDILVIASAFFLPLPESMLQEGGNVTMLKIKRVMYGVCMTISYTAAVDWLMARLHRSVHFLIYSAKYDEIATAINTTVNRGVTVLDGTGWYSKKPVKVISVLVRKPESSLVLAIVHEIDPNALVSIADVGGVFGSGFDKIKAK